MITEALGEGILRSDAAFFEALIDRDLQALEALLGEVFLIVDVASRTVHSRAAFLDAFDARTVTFKQIKTCPAKTTIRLAGPGAGIVVGRTAMSVSDAEGWWLTPVSRRATKLSSEAVRASAPRGSGNLQRNCPLPVGPGARRRPVERVRAARPARRDKPVRCASPSAWRRWWRAEAV